MSTLAEDLVEALGHYKFWKARLKKLNRQNRLNKRRVFPRWTGRPELWFHKKGHVAIFNQEYGMQDLLMENDTFWISFNMERRTYFDIGWEFVAKL